MTTELQDDIAALRVYGPSFGLMRCLWLSGQHEEAAVMANGLVARETARLEVSRKTSREAWANQVFRVIWCHLVGGNRRSARITLLMALDETGTFDVSGAALLSLQLAAWFVGDLQLIERAKQIHGGIAGGLSSRLLQASTEELRSIADELQTYVAAAPVPESSDSWHHTILAEINDRLTTAR